jgi:hypothetical protein
MPCTKFRCTAFRLRVDSVFDFPLHEPRVNPEGVDAKCDDAQKQPFDPEAKDSPSGANETELSAAEIGILGPPPLHKHDGERVADAEGADDDDGTEQLSAKPRGGTTTKLVNLAANTAGGVTGGRRNLPKGGLVVDGQGIPQKEKARLRTFKL